MANTMSHATHARRPSIRRGYSVVLGATRIKAGVGGDARAAEIGGGEGVTAEFTSMGNILSFARVGSSRRGNAT